jgi:tRNA pseudouridine55 synthase
MKLFHVPALVCLCSSLTPRGLRTAAFCTSSNFAATAVPPSVVHFPSGLCPVYKPKGWSSNHVVTSVKNIINREARKIHGSKVAIKVGHGGTLDPMAEGVLVLGIGSGTKLLGDYLAGSKGYHAVALLGQATDTLDATGTVTETVDCSQITVAQLQGSLEKFRGEILQVPPMYSALKRNGQKLYELARQGIEVEREQRKVAVYKLELFPQYEVPEFGLDIECSGGFYVRSLIADLAKEVNGVAHMTELVRTKQSCFSLDDCLYQKDWNFGEIYRHILTSSMKAQIPHSKLVSTKLGK